MGGSSDYPATVGRASRTRPDTSSRGVRERGFESGIGYAVVEVFVAGPCQIVRHSKRLGAHRKDSKR